jgi:hypothetical protein
LCLCKLDPMAHAGTRLVQRPGTEFKDARRAASRQADPPGLHVDDAIDDHAPMIESDHVNRKPHPERMNPSARYDPQSFARLEALTRQQSNRPGRVRVGDSDSIGNDRSGVDVSGNQRHPGFLTADARLTSLR